MLSQLKSFCEHPQAHIVTFCLKLRYNRRVRLGLVKPPRRYVVNRDGVHRLEQDLGLTRITEQ